MSTGPENVEIDWKAVGRRIRELRGFDTTQAELAREIGVTQGYFSHLEKGQKEPGALILYKIAKKYSTTVEWLLVGNPPTRKP